MGYKNQSWVFHVISELGTLNPKKCVFGICPPLGDAVC